MMELSLAGLDQIGNSENIENGTYGQTVCQAYQVELGESLGVGIKGRSPE